MALTRSIHSGALVALLTAAFLLGCDTRDSPRLADEHFEPPRPARPPEAARGPLHHYALAPQSQLTFRLPAREAKPAGTIAVGGELQIDVHDLSRFYGTFELDLSELHLGDDVDGTRAEWARAWLGLGRAVPTAEREKNRRASFTIRRAENATAKSAWSGRPGPTSRAKDQTKPDAADTTRVVDLDVTGDLALHGVRISHRLRCELKFHYDAAPTPAAMPTSLDVTTVGRFVVALDDHQIAPRDESGQLVAKDLPLLGRVVGKDLHLDVQLRSTLVK